MCREQFGADDYDYTNYDERTLNVNDRRQHDVRRNNYNFHGSNRRLRLIWDEKGRSLEYTLRVDTSRRGFWMTSGPQKGLERNLLSIRVLINLYQII